MNFPETRNKIVAIVATGYAWEDCVFGLPDKDYWTLNNMFKTKLVADTFDEWFQLHRPGSGEGHVDDEDMRDFLATKWKKPCWVQKPWGAEMQVINPYIYPIDEILEAYCPKTVAGIPYPYFTNTADYMICLAMLRGYEEIQLYGVEFISEVDEEYFKMRQSVNFYLGQAIGMGTKVTIQPHSSLLKTGYWYAYENPRRDPVEKVVGDNLKKIEQDKVASKTKLDEEEKRFHTLDGGAQALTQMLRIMKLRDKGAQI